LAPDIDAAGLEHDTECSESTIATAMVETIFYDKRGTVLDTVKQRNCLGTGSKRAIHIPCAPYDYDKIKSYDVRITRMTTTEVEKVQLRRHDIRTTEAGEEITGIVKNISKVKTDSAVVATFFDEKGENIGTRVVVLRDIEPDAIRQYELKFKPQDGDSVRTYVIEVGELAG
jgi:hypothetical protein